MKLPTDASAAAGQPLIELGNEVAAAILRTVEAGWKFALESPDVSADAGEVAITERLREGMRRALNSGMFRWENQMFVLPGTESRSSPDIPVPDGRTDIPIFVIGTAERFKDHDPHAIIECKRVVGNDRRLCRQYVVAGIDRFQTGKYAGSHSIGFMTGYLIAGDAEFAVGGVNRYLNGKSRSAENLQPSILIAESWVWRSRHQREGRSRIELHHALLSFPPFNSKVRRGGGDSAGRT